MATLDFSQLVSRTADSACVDMQIAYQVLLAALGELRGFHGVEEVRLDTLTGHTRSPGTASTGKGMANCFWCHEIHSIDEVKQCRVRTAAKQRAQLDEAKAGLLKLSELLDE